jgi:hypothetical protein
MHNNTNTLRRPLSGHPALDAGAYPVLLPHITCLGQDLFIGSRKMDKLLPEQTGFLLDCNGRHPFSELLFQHALKATDILHLTRYLLWWPEPVKENVNLFPAPERLILCSKPEIPMLSIGARMIREAQDVSTTLLTCFDSAAESANLLFYKGVGDYRLARLDEDFLLARLSGMAQLHWNNSFLRIGEETFHRLILAHLTKTRPTTIFIPAALGGDTAALLIRNTIIALYAEGYIKSEIHLYADEPPAHGHRLIDEFESWFEDSYLTPVGYSLPVGNTAIHKQAILDLFNCQPLAEQKKAWLNPVERFWKLNFTALI